MGLIMRRMVGLRRMGDLLRLWMILGRVLHLCVGLRGVKRVCVVVIVIVIIGICRILGGGIVVRRTVLDGLGSSRGLNWSRELGGLLRILRESKVWGALKAYRALLLNKN